MSSANELLDLSALPARARREVRDFYEFLLARHQPPRKKVRPRTLPAAFDSPIKVKEYVRVTRDEIYDEI